MPHLKLIFIGNFRFNGEAVILSNVTVGKIYDVEVGQLVGWGQSLHFIGDDGKKFSISNHFITEGYFRELTEYRAQKLDQLMLSN